MQSLIDASSLPFATMFWDKSVIDEQHPQHIGMYDGALLNEHVRAFVEGCDRVLIGRHHLSDFNSGAFTARLDPDKIIRISHHRVHVGKEDLSPMSRCATSSRALTRAAAEARLAAHRTPRRPGAVVRRAAATRSPPRRFIPRWEKFLRPDDILVAETGTVSMGLGFARMPAGATFYNQTLWGSIGWATPAAFGAAVAAPDRRVVLITGEGAHQLTAQEIGQFAALRPQAGHLRAQQRRLSHRAAALQGARHRLQRHRPWRYAELPHALGCDGWFTARVTTCGELDARSRAATRPTTGAYIEVVTDPYAASPLALKLHDAIKTLYKA